MQLSLGEVVFFPRIRGTDPHDELELKGLKGWRRGSKNYSNRLQYVTFKSWESLQKRTF